MNHQGSQLRAQGGAVSRSKPIFWQHIDDGSKCPFAIPTFLSISPLPPPTMALIECSSSHGPLHHISKQSSHGTCGHDFGLNGQDAACSRSWQGRFCLIPQNANKNISQARMAASMEPCTPGSSRAVLGIRDPRRGKALVEMHSLTGTGLRQGAVGSDELPCCAELVSRKSKQATPNYQRHNPHLERSRAAVAMNGRTVRPDHVLGRCVKTECASQGKLRPNSPIANTHEHHCEEFGIRNM